MYTIIRRKDEEQKADLDELLEDIKAQEFRLGLFAEH